MSIPDFLETIGIKNTGTEGENDSYVIDLNSSNEYGRIFSKLEKSEEVELLYDNQVVTEEGSSLVYEAKEESLMLNLIADFEGDRYQLIINKI